MSRKLASIQRIISLSPIPGADNIEVAGLLGWKCIVKKGEYRTQDLCVFCEVDSVLPEKPTFEFLRNRNFRIKTCKMRGQVSQGICFPLSILSDITPVEGLDVTEAIGVTKYEPYIPANLSGLVKGSFPEFLHKTDEERIQNVPQLLEIYKDKEFYVTEKVDGSSVTYYVKDGVFGVCSRNLELKETEGNALWKKARELDIERKLLSMHCNVAIQGELFGMGIQKNKYNLPGVEYYIFNIFDIDKGLNLNFLDFISTAATLGLKTVPIVTNSFKLLSTVDEMVEYSKGKSLVNLNAKREGVVVRPLVETFDEVLQGRLSFKTINPDFLLKHEE